ncbi:hypothetical protein [Sporisorium scitamineum]|uniref:Uncharacterized protein n=1 Tax=Sporisorium scitamineum TaxID=49012 RepID=A0A0F7S6S4_9BASI|nr:hypothetical protein [Sporisorium scitamineum]
MVDTLKLEAILTESYVHLANSKHIKMDSMVMLSINAQGANNELPCQEFGFEVLPKSKPFMILGKPWKTRVCVLQVYELDIMYIPSFEHCIHSWTPVMSVMHHRCILPIPSMPMEAICLLSATEPCMPSVKELKQLAVAAGPWLQI